MFDLRKELSSPKLPEKPTTGLHKHDKPLVGLNNLDGSPLPELMPGMPSEGDTHHLVSYSQWSFHDLVLFILHKIGPSEVYFTSWAISENPVREMLRMRRDGLITGLHCLLDSRIKSQCPAAAQLIFGNVDSLFLTDIHAKTAAIIGRDLSASLVATANLTNKRRIERYVLCYNQKLAQFEVDWIKKAMQNAHPWN